MLAAFFSRKDSLASRGSLSSDSLQSLTADSKMKCCSNAAAKPAASGSKDWFSSTKFYVVPESLGLDRKWQNPQNDGSVLTKKGSSSAARSTEPTVTDSGFGKAWLGNFLLWTVRCQAAKGTATTILPSLSATAMIEIKNGSPPPLCLENSDGVIQVWLRLLAHKGCALPELLWTLGNLRRGQLVLFNFGHLQATLSL